LLHERNGGIKMGKERRTRRWRFGGRKETEEAYERADRDRTLLLMALNDLAFKKVHWIREGSISAGVCRPTGASGGIVILKSNGYVSAHYLEEWVNYQKRSTVDIKNKEQVDLYSLACKVHVYQFDEFEKERKEGDEHISSERRS
jgi:hypothetical protein